MSKAEKAIDATIEAKHKSNPPTVTIDFPEEQKVQPEGFGSLTLEREISCTLTGKVTSLSTSNWSDDKTKSIRIEVTSCVFSVDREAPMSIDEAMDEEKKTRRRV